MCDDWDPAIVFINSKYKTSGTASDFSVYSPNTLVNRNKAYNYIEVRQVVLPMTFYNVRATIGNNTECSTIYFTNSSAEEKKYAVPDGYYNIEDLMAKIKAGLDSNDGTGTTYTVELVVDSTTSTILTHKVRISADANFALRFGDDSINSLIPDLLGYERSDTSAGTTFTASKIYSLRNNGNFIHIGSNIQTNTFNFSDNNGSVSLSNKYGSLSILASVPINDFGTYVYGNTSRLKLKTNVTQLNGFQFKLLDENYNIIDTNGQDWSMELIFS